MWWQLHVSARKCSHHPAVYTAVAIKPDGCTVHSKHRTRVELSCRILFVNYLYWCTCARMNSDWVHILYIILILYLIERQWIYIGRYTNILHVLMSLNILYHRRTANHFNIFDSPRRLPTIHQPTKHGLLSKFLTLILNLYNLIIYNFYITLCVLWKVFNV